MGLCDAQSLQLDWPYPKAPAAPKSPSGAPKELGPHLPSVFPAAEAPGEGEVKARVHAPQPRPQSHPTGKHV